MVEKEGGRDRERLGIQTWDARSATALYVSAAHKAVGTDSFFVFLFACLFVCIVLCFL